VLFLNTIVTACFFQLLLLNGYVKHSGYFGSFLAAYCVTLIQGPLLSGPIVGLKGRTYKMLVTLVDIEAYVVTISHACSCQVMFCFVLQVVMHSHAHCNVLWWMDTLGRWLSRLSPLPMYLHPWSPLGC
jgi:hypothetical protein